MKKGMQRRKHLPLMLFRLIMAAWLAAVVPLAVAASGPLPQQAAVCTL